MLVSLHGLGFVRNHELRWGKSCFTAGRGVGHNSMTDFKQIIGRGTRVRDDYGKLYFNILDYTGSATRMFADPDFDGEPTLITEEEMDASGTQVEVKVVEPEKAEDLEEVEFNEHIDSRAD